MANGQIDPAVTTSVPPPATTPEGDPAPATRVPATTTTVPPTVTPTVAIPNTIPPPVFAGEPVRRFQWSGQGNAGVRAWLGDDGQDYLGVIRGSADVPVALVEFVYMTNPLEAELLADPAFVEVQAQALADSIVTRFTDAGATGTGPIADMSGVQPFGGGGRSCAAADLADLVAVPVPAPGSPIGR